MNINNVNATNINNVEIQHSKVLSFKSASSSLIAKNNRPISGWECNISHNYVFNTSHPHQLQIKPRTNDGEYTQFNLLCKLLLAGTCSTIYIDETLDLKQQAYVRTLQSASGTKIVNTRLAHVFIQNKRLQA